MLNKLNESLRKAIMPEVVSGQDETSLHLTKQEFMDKMLKEKDGWQLLDLLEIGEANIAERLGLIHGYLKNSQVYFDIPSWHHLVAHLRIVNSV